MSEREDFIEEMETGYFEGCGETFDTALHDASEKAKKSRTGWYHVVKIEVNVEDSIHDYKVLLGP